MKRRDDLHRGVIVFITLAILTVIEYFLGINLVPQFLLWIIAIAKLVLVVHFFMHFYRLFAGDQGGHE